MFVAVDGSPVAQHAIEHDRRLFHGGRKCARLDSAESATRLLVCVMEATGSAAGTLILTLQGEFGTQSYSGGKSIKFKTVPPNPRYTFSAFRRISRAKWKYDAGILTLAFSKIEQHKSESLSLGRER